MEDGIANAIIESMSLDIDRGLLTGYLNLNYGGSFQGFGGYCLYQPKTSLPHYELKSVAGHFINRCMQICGVESWDDAKGKTIRVEIKDGLILKIGHIIKDDWFCPAVDFKND